MIVLDTNVLSGIVSERPDSTIVQWLDSQEPEDLFTTTVTCYESLKGIRKLDPSRRRTLLEQAFVLTLEKLNGRILAFDFAAAEFAATLAASRQRAGRAIEVRDTLIAGIVKAHKAVLATANTRHFADADIPLVNPLEQL